MPETPAPNMHHVSAFHSGEQAVLIPGGLPMRWSAPEYSPTLENTGSWDAAQR